MPKKPAKPASPAKKVAPKLRAGIVNLNAGLNGNGFPPLPQYQVQGVGSGTVVVGQACKAP
jgi:hypothetical protein